MVTGITLRTPIGPKDTRIPTFFPISETKNSSSSKIINFLMSYQGLGQSILIDNQDSANPVTVRINGQVNTFVIPASNFRSIDNQWIEQIELTGASTNTIVTAQVVPREQVGV